MQLQQLRHLSIERTRIFGLSWTGYTVDYSVFTDVLGKRFYRTCTRSCIAGWILRGGTTGLITWPWNSEFWMTWYLGRLYWLNIPRTTSVVIMPRPHRAGALCDDARLTPVCLTSIYHVHRAKSRTERPRKTKIGIEVAHVTRDSETTFKVKRSKVNLQGRGRGILWRPPAQLVINSLSTTHMQRHISISCSASDVSPWLL